MNETKINDDDLLFMQQSLILAQKAKGFCSPNPAVGAILISGRGKIEGKGFTCSPGNLHAEPNALKKHHNVSAFTTLYTTLEPCCVSSRTPPCTKIILEKKINRLVIGSLDPNPKINGKGVELLRKKGLQVDILPCSKLTQDIKELNEDYFFFIKHSRPFFTAKYAMTLDGKISSASGDSKWISSLTSRKIAHQMRKNSDAILVGSGTIQQDNPKLTARCDLDIPQKFQPLRIIVSGKGILNTNSTILQDNNPLLLVSKHESKILLTPQEKLKRNKTFQYLHQSPKKQIWFDPNPEETINLQWLSTQLAKKNVLSILMEGGTKLLTYALHHKMICKISCFISTNTLLGYGSLPFCNLSKIDLTMRNAFKLHDIRVQTMDSDVLVTGYLESKNIWSISKTL